MKDIQVNQGQYTIDGDSVTHSVVAAPESCNGDNE
jgi:hypothetical protein